MKTKKLKIILVLLLFFLIGLIVLTNVTITSPRIRDVARNQLEKALERKVRIGELKINLGKGIEIKKLSIENRKGSQPGRFLQVGTLRVRYRLLPLLERKLVIGRMVLINPRIFLDRDREGKWNFSDLLTSREKVPVAKGGISLKRTSFLISRIIISGGEVILRDGKVSDPPTETKLDNLDLDVSGFSLIAPFRFLLTGNLEGKEPAPLTLKGKVELLPFSKLEVNLAINNFVFSSFQPYLKEYVPLTYLTGKANLNLNCQMDKEKNLDLTGRMEGKNIGLEFPLPSTAREFPLERVNNLNFSFDLNKLTANVTPPLKIKQLEGTLNIDQGEVKLARIEVPLNNIKGKFEIKRNKISFSELRANLGDGTINLQGEIHNKGEDFFNISRLAYSFRADWQNLALDSLLPSPKLKGMLLGKLEGRASFQGQQISPEAISGQGELRIKGGKLIGMPLMQLLVSLLRMPSLAEIDFQEIYADFSLKDQLIRTDNLRLLSQDMGMFAKGTFDFAANLDYKLTLRISPEISADFPLRSLYPQDKEGWTIIETSLTGTFNKPKLDLLKAPMEQLLKKGFQDILNIFGK
ncbi:MAG: DUF748 domain-containing protein [Nitrospirae bacterium]|nr:DUF748 domain-containing protein [Nitrospirota bacterium]